MKPKICVVGSANIDQVSYVKRAPNDGETLFGESYQMGFGGKGANQAVMAGLLGAEVYVIACLGSDVYREMTIENFKNNNVITDYIQTVEGSSGVAPIWVDESGQNRIVVIPGANNLLDSSLAIESLEKIGKPDVLVGQFEIPMSVNEQVFSYAYKNGVQTVLNPAPANKPTDVLLENTSWFIPNEVEFEEIYGEVFNEDNLLLFAKDLKTNIVVTLGEKGCAYIKNNSVKILDTDSVKAIDTTGAGDAFVGAFSFALASKLDIEECLKLALQKATDSVTKKGTQSSYKD
jgi:ribokinase